MKHYVYRLKNINPIDERIYYIGKHSGELDDLHTKKYKTSSKKVQPIFDNFKIKIVRIFDNLKDAIEFEGYYHNKINVANHHKFYNQINQSINSGLDRTGKVTVFDNILNERITISVDILDYERYIPINKGYILCKDKNTGVKKVVSKKEFNDDKNLVGINYGIIHCITKSNGEKVSITTDEYHKNKHLYDYTQARRISAYDTIENKKVQIEPEHFDGNRYIGIKAYTKEGVKECELCKKEISKSNYERHLLTHNKKIIYVTDNKHKNTINVTEYEFYTNLQKTHYICESGMNIYLNGNIIRKRKEKTGLLKKEKCPICGKEIGGVYNLKKHINSHN